MTSTRINIYHGFAIRSDWDDEEVTYEAMVSGLSKNVYGDTDGYRLAYSYEADYDFPFDSLDDIYRRNQAVDGTEENVKAGKRSLSVGDVIVFTVEGMGTYLKMVTVNGFVSISAEALLAKVVA